MLQGQKGRNFIFYIVVFLPCSNSPYGFVSWLNSVKYESLCISFYWLYKNHHKFSSLKLHKYTVSSNNSSGQESKIGSNRLNLGSNSCMPSEGFKKESISFSFPFCRGCLHSLARGPLLSSSKPATLSQVLLMLLHFWFSLFCSLFPFEGPYWLHWAPGITQDHPRIKN